jgi:non-heme chloroperoxidase
MSNDKPPILFVHGAWTEPSCWDNYIPAFEAAGYRCLAPTLRHHDCRPDDDPHLELCTVSIRDYVDDLEAIVNDLDAVPIVIGHSMGGLLAQLLLARIPARAGVLLSPAWPWGVWGLPLTSLRTFAPQFATWRFWRKPCRPSAEQVAYGIANRMAPEDQRKLHQDMVFDSGRALAEMGLWPLDRARATEVDPSRITCPLLIIAGRNDRITPASMAHKIARFYGDVAEFHELPGHAHYLLGEPGWERVVEDVIHWLATRISETIRSCA